MSEHLRARRTGGGVGSLTLVSPRVAAPAIRPAGRALDTGIQARMSARFGHDFSQVRIHTDSEAAEAAQAVGAKAYTRGEDIVFNEDRYAPGSREGDRLLAHELTHVVQQAK